MLLLNMLFKRDTFIGFQVKPSSLDITNETSIPYLPLECVSLVSKVSKCIQNDTKHKIECQVENYKEERGINQESS